ncbi:MAG: hypothetical protein M3Z26_08655 [Bacteroidota bacterium]|nr:hypothetical protein [Bacteroidota bacterium]
MRKLIIIVCFFNFIHSVNAQHENEYPKIDQAILAIPSSQTNNTTDIANYIKKHFDSDDKKIRAAFTWVTSNIKYDTDSIHRVILEEDRDQKVTFALRRRKGVCENFAAIFNDICLKSGITSFAIEGYTKQNGAKDKISHVWCGAFINDKWFLYDPTWDEGFIYNSFNNNPITKYFQVPPEDFVQTHLPYDPLFEFLNYPVTYKEFLKGNTAINTSKSYFNFIDSISVYEKMDSLSRYLSALSRIEKNEITIAKPITKTKQIKLEIELIYQDRDMAFYNEAVAGYNDAIIIFNNYINYRNNQFQPAKKPEEVQEMFSKIRKLMSAANFKLNEVNHSKSTLTLDTGDLQKKLDDLNIHIKEQETFQKNYTLK